MCVVELMFQLYKHFVLIDNLENRGVDFRKAFITGNRDCSHVTKLDVVKTSGKRSIGSWRNFLETSQELGDWTVAILRSVQFLSKAASSFSNSATAAALVAFLCEAPNYVKWGQFLRG